MLKMKHYPLILAPRGYVLIEGRWRHVYVRESFTQVDIFGDNHDMYSVQLSKKSNVQHQILAKDLLKEKPRRSRAERADNGG